MQDSILPDFAVSPKSFLPIATKNLPNSYLYNYTNCQLFCGDAKEVLKNAESNSCDLILTSPPYDNLRDYEGFDFDFEGIAIEFFRILKEGGVIVWIVGDATIDGSESLNSFRQALYFKELGLKIHDTMIYQKNNFSNPSKRRYHQIFEYMFVISKGVPKTFNAIMDRKNIYAGASTLGQNTTRKVDGSFAMQKRRVIKEYGMRYNIWKGNTSGQENMCKAIAHPATFPLWLARDHIKTWSNEGDVVCDPFCGSGTTGVACVELERKFIGIDIEAKYVEMACERIKKARGERGLFAAK